MNFSKATYFQSLLFIFLFLLAGCGTQKVNQSSTDRLYKKQNSELNARYVIYHINDSISQLFYDISNEAMVYKKTDTSTYFYSYIRLLLKISPEDRLNLVQDTASVFIMDRQTEVLARSLKGSIYFKLKSGSNYYTEVNVYDLHKKTRYTHSLYTEKVNKDSRQNFLITNSLDEVLFSAYYKPRDLVYVRSERNPEKLFNIDYFNPDFKLAPPPFSVVSVPKFNYLPDSTFSAYKTNERIELVLPEKGFYHLKTNDQTLDGVSFFVYEPTYPKIRNEEQMILSTRFIMAKKEFDNCMSAVDKKAAIDKFWLDVSGSNERAKELIKKYYGRVQEANRLFTSYQEGWKTDRGMIYIVFGAPNKVTKFKNGEVWTYGESGNPNAIVYSFIKNANPFTDNDFVLERYETFKMPWYQAVDMWRQGRIYLDN